MEYIKIANKFIFKIIIFFVILMNNIIFCVIKKDIDFPYIIKLNNGNYLAIATKGIFMYNPTLTAKIDIKIFDYRTIEINYEAYSTNIVQFLTEDDGYIICLSKNETHIISKNGKYLTQYTLDYIKDQFYPIIPYGHSNNEYYYSIISIEGGELLFRKYIYNSENNSVSYNDSYIYNIGPYFSQNIACELMYYLGNKVIICFYGNWYDTFYIIFNITDLHSFDEIIELKGSVPNAGGQFYRSDVITFERNKAACCSMHNGDLVCFVYNIDSNIYTNAFNVSELYICDCETIDMLVKYFPEREEFVFSCIKYSDIYLGIFSKNGNYELYNATDLINVDYYGIPNRINIGYSPKSEKYVIFTDTDNKSLFSLDLINGTKINDFPIDEPGPLICDYYYNYEKTECIEVIPEGYYCNNTYLKTIDIKPDGYYYNDSSFKTIDKCHQNCQKCEKGPTAENNNCLICKEQKFYDLGNCVDNCQNGYFKDTDNINKCKCSSDIKCFYCSEESLKENLCIICNNDKGYYQRIDDEKRNDSFINCYKNLEGYYLDNKIYKKCFPTCKSCNEYGTENNNKCTECINTHEFKDYLGNDKNCYEKCDYYYYFDSLNKFHCIENCPVNYNKFIYSKKQCIDNCEKDNKFKYEYKNLCYEKCPLNTISSSNNIYLCQKKSEEECVISNFELNNSTKDISINLINSFTKQYIIDSKATNNYISKYENNFISIYIYKNSSCLENTSSSAPKINFSECYEKLKIYYDISEDLIISIININTNDNSNPITTYTFTNPLTGELLNSTKICYKEKIIIEEDVRALMGNIDDKKEEFIIYLTRQGIDVFNLSHQFYNDICCHFKSPNGRDVPLKDRISVFFPNITLCDRGCENKGVDLNNLKAKCLCTFNDLMSYSLLKNNVYGQYIEEILDVVSSINIAVLKCIKDIFIKKYIVKCYGAYIFTFLFLCQITCIIKFGLERLKRIKKYFSSLIESYFNYKSLNKNSKNDIDNTINIKNLIKENFPPKREKKSKSKTENNLYQTNNILIFQNKNKNTSLENLELNRKSKIKKHSSKSQKKIHEKNNIEDNFNIKEYLSKSFDENDFDDVIEKERRKFLSYFKEKFKENQIFINAFYIKEPLRPKELKILVIIITIELYFIINGLFYTEEYLSQLFHYNKKISFFYFVPKRFNYFIYTSAVSNIITYLIEYFFIEEKKIKKMFIRNKRSKNHLKKEIGGIVKNIEKRFIVLIIFSIILNIFGFIYISCFNIVYPYIKIEWLKSSIFILITMQFINFIITFIESCLRYLAIKCNSEKLFKLSLILA